MSVNYLDTLLNECVTKFYKKSDKLTKDQFFICLKEAIDSGDFARECTELKMYTNVPEQTVATLSQSQRMTYKPYRIVLDLRKERDQAIELLRELSESLDPFGNVKDSLATEIILTKITESKLLEDRE